MAIIRIFRPRRSGRGFSLVELVITILITAILAGVFFIIVKTTADAWVLLSTRRLLYQDGRAALDMILRELRHLDVFYHFGIDPEEWAEKMNPDYTGEVTVPPFIGPYLWGSSILIGENQHIQFLKDIYGVYDSGWEKGLLASAYMVDFRYDPARRQIIKTFPEGIYDWETDTYTLLGYEWIVSGDVEDFRISYGTYGDPYGGGQAVTFQSTYGGWGPDLIRVQITLKRGGHRATFAGTIAPRRWMATKQFGEIHPPPW